jgi:hypothetical protein
MGERVDALTTAGDGAFAVIATAVGKTGSARAVLRTGAGTPPRSGPPAAPVPARTPSCSPR